MADELSMASGLRRVASATRPEARYQAILANLPDALLAIFDTKGRVLAVDGGAASRIPVPVASFVGRRPSEIIEDERGARVDEAFRIAVVEGEQTTFDFEGPSGNVWWVSVVPMHDEEGGIVGGMSVWRDVSARMRAQHELERSNAELEQFAYIASHDLSEPLRMVTGYLNLLERRYGDTLDDDARQFIGFAVDGAARMRGLIDDLLAFSRIGRGNATAEPVDVQALVEAAFRDLTVERDGPEATLLATGLPTIHGDPTQLRQLFQNLLGNALKFVEPGRGAVVEVTAERAAGGHRFVVADEGIGIDPDQTERVFGVFQRLHTRDEFPGTGIGLAVARKVVEGHRGSILARPRAGGGTEIVFELRTP